MAKLSPDSKDYYQDIQKIKTEEEALKWVKERFASMKWARSSAKYWNIEIEWDKCDKQVRANSFYRNWELIVNLPLEANLLEYVKWEFANEINFDVEPSQEQDIEQTQPAKYALAYFMDKEDFYNEDRKWIIDWWTYWTAIRFTGIQTEIVNKYELKDDVDYNKIDIFSNLKNYRKYEEINRLFMPKNVPIRNYWLDDRALWQPDLQKAIDCIMQDDVPIEEFKLKFSDKSIYKNTDKVWTAINEYPEYWNTNAWYYNTNNNINNNVILHYYFNRITKDFIIMANEQYIIYHWKMMYRDWWLPFQSSQFYTDNTCFYGKWIPNKVRYAKAYKSEMMQNALFGANMMSWINMVVWNKEEISWEFSMWSRSTNIIRMTWDVQNMQQLNVNTNLNAFQSMIVLLDDSIIQDTGINVKMPYQSPASTATEIAVMEENKALRWKAISQSRNLCLDKTLTQVLWNIGDFVPAVKKKIIKDDNWNIKKVEFPKIKIKDIRITKKKWKTVVEEDYGNYWFLEIKPKTLQGDLTVKITTPSSKALPLVLQKEWYSQYINNLATLISILWPEAGQEILNKYPVEEIIDYMNKTWWYWEKLTAKSKKDEIDREAKDKTKELMQSVWLWTLDINQLKQNDNSPQTMISQEKWIWQTLWWIENL